MFDESTELCMSYCEADSAGNVSNSTSYFNGRGQVNKSTYQAGTSNHNATSIKYDVMGRRSKVSRPSDTGSSQSDWSEIAYDYLGRAQLRIG